MTLRNRTLDNSSFLTQSSKHQSTKSNDKEKQSSKKQTSQYQAKQSSSKEENQRQTRSTTKKSHPKQAQPKPHTPRVRSKSRINTNRKKPFNRSKSESDAITSSKSNTIEKPKITKKKTRKWIFYLLLTFHHIKSSHASISLTILANTLQLW